MGAEENNNYEERNLLVPSVEEIKKKELIRLLVTLIRNYVSKELRKESKEND